MNRNIAIVAGILLVNCLGCLYYFESPVKRIPQAVVQNFTREINIPPDVVDFLKDIRETLPTKSQTPTKSQSLHQHITHQISPLNNGTRPNLNLTGSGLKNPNILDIFTNFSISFKDLKVGPKQPLNNNKIHFEKFVVNLSTKAPVKTNEISDKPVLMSTTFKPNPDYINPHPYNFTINNVSVCVENSSSPLIMIIVCTALGNNKARTAIRETWGSPGELRRWNARLVFLMGATLNQKLQENVEEENKQYHDIIQENFLDTYRNLTLKSIALLKWVRKYCLNSKYVLKSDDDMFINVKVLRSTLIKIKQTRFLTGAVIVGAKPLQAKTSKWYTPLSEYSKRFYPRYCSGTAYAMSTDLVSDLYIMALNTKFFWLEDIYITGMCAGQLQAKYIPDNRYTFRQRPATGCAFLHQISGHRVSVKEMYKIWRELQSPHCKKRN